MDPPLQQAFQARGLVDKMKETMRAGESYSGHKTTQKRRCSRATAVEFKKSKEHCLNKAASPIPEQERGKGNDAWAMASFFFHQNTYIVKLGVEFDHLAPSVDHQSDGILVLSTSGSQVFCCLVQRGLDTLSYGSGCKERLRCQVLQIIIAKSVWKTHVQATFIAATYWASATTRSTLAIAVKGVDKPGTVGLGSGTIETSV